MTSDRIGFEPSLISNSAVLVVNSLILIVAIIKWNSDGKLNLSLFFSGFVASIFDTLGKVLSLNALNYGPGGPSCALTGLSGPYLVVIVALVG